MAREITEKTLLKLYEDKRENRRSGRKEKTVLRVVQWNNYRPLLEKREFYRDGSTWKAAKAKGLNIDDFHYIADNWEDIVELLEGDEEEQPSRRGRGSSKKSKRGSSRKKSSAKKQKRQPVLTEDDDDDDDLDDWDDEDDDDFADYD